MPTTVIAMEIIQPDKYEVDFDAVVAYLTSIKVVTVAHARPTKKQKTMQLWHL